jgi:hypothetical protein
VPIAADRPSEHEQSGKLVLAINSALAGVPAAYVASGSLIVTALAAATAAIVTLIVSRPWRR